MDIYFSNDTICLRLNKCMTIINLDQLTLLVLTEKEKCADFWEIAR